MTLRIRIAATIRLTPCFAQKWKRVPLRVPMNNRSNLRSVQAIAHAIAHEGDGEDQLVQIVLSRADHE